MNNPMLYQVGGILLILCFLVFLALSFKTWRIWHLLWTFAAFGAALAFIVMAAASLKTRTTWLKQYVVLKTQLVDEKARNELLLKGDLTAVRQTNESIRSIRGKLERMLVDRGRVWRQCAPQGPPANNVMQFSTVRPDNQAAPPPNQIKPKSVLYAFLEREEAGNKVPWFFLGEFTAEEATDTTVGLRPLLPMDAIQQRLSGAQGTWALYEVMPRDNHHAFALDPEYSPDLSKELDPVFGEPDEQELLRIFSAVITEYMQDTPAADRAQRDQELRGLVDLFLRDGKRALDSDSQDDTWVKVRFLKKHTVDVNVAANALQGAVNSQSYFDSNGMAVVADLSRADGTPVEFEPDDVALFDHVEAEDLISKGIGERVENVYLRPLLDFTVLFYNVAEQRKTIARELAAVQRDKTILEGTKARLEQQITYYTEAKTQLQGDKGLLEQELAAATAFQQKLDQERTKMLGELRSFYSANRKMADELRQIYAQLNELAKTQRAAALSQAQSG